MATVSVYFTDIKQQIRAHLSRARNSIKIAVAWFTDEDLMSDLIEIKKNNPTISIQVIISNAEENFVNRRNLLKLQKANVELRVMNTDQGFLHHKFCLIDTKYIINGSYNWTYYASDKNEENITIIEVEAQDRTFLQFITKFNFYFTDKRSTYYNSELALVEATEIFRKYDEGELALRTMYQQEVVQTLEAIKTINPQKVWNEQIDFQKIYQSIERYGDGVNLVKKLLRDEKGNGMPKSGLQKLAIWGELELSFEWKALQMPYRRLFDKSELETCETLIERLGGGEKLKALYNQQ